MNSTKSRLALVFAMLMFGLVGTALSVWAHHSFTAEFDIYKPVVIEGTITNVEWINPHIQIYLDAKDEHGATGQWKVESWGTGNMHRAGIVKEKLTPGTQVKMRAYHAKDGTQNFAYLRNLTFLKDGSSYELWVGGQDGTPVDQRK